MVREGTHSVGGVALRYRIAGTGPEPLVLVHGVGSCLEAWDGVVEHLTAHFTVLSFDLRGHGGSARVAGRYEIEDFAREALALADLAGFDSFHLAGFSLGGLIAQQMAIVHPSRIRRLVLLSTVAGRTLEEKARVLQRLDALQTGQPGSHHDASLARWLTEDFQTRNPDVVARLRERNARNDPGCYAAAYRVLAQTDLGDALDRIRAPTLIATGEDDIGSNPRMAAFMHERIAGSAIRILPGLRHSILTEAPDLVGPMMAEFLLGSKVPG